MVKMSYSSYFPRIFRKAAGFYLFIYFYLQCIYHGISQKKKLKLFRQIGRTTLKLHLLPLETVTTPKNANHRNSTLGRSSHYILYLVIKGFIQL